MRVYIAGPLNADAVNYLKNVHRFIEADAQLRELGYATYNPAIDFIIGMYTGTYEYSDYFLPSQEWLAASDVIFAIDHSPGADAEVERAVELGIPVVWSVDELVEAFPTHWVYP